MLEDRTFIIITLSVLAFGLFSARFARGIVTPPMAFMVIGILVSPHALGISNLTIDHPAVYALAELTLVLVLFTDAARIDFRELRQEYTIPLRLLGIGMPITIVVGGALAYLMFPELGLWPAALLGAILAPTDAALGVAVVTSDRVPVRIRQAINVESGLNDGIAVPVVLLFAAFAELHAHAQPATYWAGFIAKQLSLGPLAGIAIGFAGGQVITWAERTGSMSFSFRQLSGLCIALLAYASAQYIGGNGFIAAFTAGLTMGNTAKSHCECLYNFAETEGQLLALLAFLLFGTLMVWPCVHALDWRILVYALLSLTVIRMGPVAISLLRTGMRWRTVTFVGWFGPRGLASILFALIVHGRAGIAEREYLFHGAVATIVLSVLLHGISAMPAAAWYGRYSDTFKDEEGAPEHASAPELRVRLPHPRRSPRRRATDHNPK